MSDKTIVWFCTHKWSSFWSTISDLKEFTKSENVLKWKCIWSWDFDNLQSDVKEILTDNNLSFN